MKVKDIHSSTLSSKGQVTIPVKVRELLNLKERDSVTFEITYTGDVLIKPVAYKLKDSFGAVKPLNKTFQEQRETSKKERLAKYK